MEIWEEICAMLTSDAWFEQLLSEELSQSTDVEELIAWKKGIAKLVECQNVFIKLGGLAIIGLIIKNPSVLSNWRKKLLHT